jgi:uncharacterized protein YabN with tetrapyrrole methylase and pyrophosphatase domain
MEALLDGLLDPKGGCPWDLAQTHRSISEDFLEEAYELREALLSEDPREARGEAGDLLFLICFLGRLARRDGLDFGMTEVIDASVDKMVSRHPHVFREGAERPGDAEGVLVSWHALKRAERKGRTGLLASIPLALPALARHYRIRSKVSKAGIDLAGPGEARERLSAALGALDAAIGAQGGLGPKGGPRAKAPGAPRSEPGPDKDCLERALGDTLAALSDLSRHLGVSPERALDGHNRRLAARMLRLESELRTGGWAMEDVPKEELEGLWEKTAKA